MTDPLEDLVTATLHRRAQRARVSPDAWSRIVERAERTTARARLARRAAIAGVAAVALTALALPVLRDRTVPAEPDVVLTQPPATPEPTLPAPVVPQPPAWSRAADDAVLGAEDYVYLEDLATYEGQVVAVGSYTADGDLLPTAEVWRSEDGQRWTAAGLGADEASAYGVAGGVQALVAVGQAAGQPVAWVSADAADWTQVELPGTGVAREVVWTGERFVAVGEEGSERGPAMWTSPDGWTWEAQTLPLLGGEGVLDHVVVMPDQIVALGRSSVAVSVDGGLSWTQRTIAEAGFDPATTAFEAVLAPPDGTALVLAVGADTAVTAYSSTDGLTWTPVGLLGGQASRVTGLAMRNDGMLVAVGLHTGDSRGAAWTSGDGGRTWTEGPDAFGVGTRPNAVTDTDGGLVAVGTDETEGIPRGAAWTAR